MTTRSGSATMTAVEQFFEAARTFIEYARAASP
jgi:hypothetical protein